MADIIEDKARTSEWFPFDLHCSKCDSKVRVELSDVVYGGWKVGGYWFAGTEEIEHHFTWDCPACGHGFNKIDPVFVPIGIQQDAKAEYRRLKAEGKPIV